MFPPIAFVAYRKGQFIGCVNSIITQFGFAHPVCKLKLLVTHGYSFYGSSLWDLYDGDSKKLYITWNIAVRRLYDLPRTAHTRFLTHIAGVPHVNLNLKCRFANLYTKQSILRMRKSLSKPNYACITLCQSPAVMSLTCCVNST